MNDEVASISFNFNKFVQHKANIECNYCHKKGHFANGQAQDWTWGIHKHLIQANVDQETSLNNVQFLCFILIKPWFQGYIVINSKASFHLTLKSAWFKIPNYFKIHNLHKFCMIIKSKQLFILTFFKSKSIMRKLWT
jgi:hypothetical protein